MSTPDESDAGKGVPMSVKDGSTAPLLPCPFCFSDLIRPHRVGAVFWQECAGCECEGPVASTREAAIAAWNRRPEPSPEVGPSPPVWKDIAALADFALSDSLIDRDGNGYYDDAKFIRALAGNGYRIVPAEPSPEDVERVARAICCPSGHCHIVALNERAETARHYSKPWPCCWRQHAERARAAIAALGRGCK